MQHGLLRRQRARQQQQRCGHIPQNAFHEAISKKSVERGAEPAGQPTRAQTRAAQSSSNIARIVPFGARKLREFRPERAFPFVWGERAQMRMGITT
jgi:hypothetical protein